MATTTDAAGYIPPDLPLPSQPVDTAGGPPATYGQQIMDLFKYGIGAYTSLQAQKNAIDYSMYQTVQGQQAKAGQPAPIVVQGSAPSAGMSSSTMMLMIAGGLVVLLLVVRSAR